MCFFDNTCSLFVTLSASRQVVFMSQLSRDLVNPATGHIVIFDNVITNIGHAYSRSTGVFRAPVDGNYMFNMIASNQPSAGNHCLHLLMRRNGNAIGYIFLDSNHDFYFKRTENVVVSLTKGGFLGLFDPLVHRAKQNRTLNNKCILCLIFLNKMFTCNLLSILSILI